MKPRRCRLRTQRPVVVQNRPQMPHSHNPLRTAHLDMPHTLGRNRAQNLTGWLCSPQTPHSHNPLRTAHLDMPRTLGCNRAQNLTGWLCSRPCTQRPGVVQNRL